MQKNVKWRFVIAGIVLCAALVYLMPTFSQSLPDLWERYLPTDRVHLGLDLQGGIHLILEVESDKAVESTVERTVMDMKDSFRKRDIFYDTIERDGVSRMMIRGVSPSDRDRLEEILSEQYANLRRYPPQTGKRGVDFMLGLTDREIAAVKEGAVEQALETIRNRIDQYGVSEPTIQRERENRILVQLPGVRDPERAINLIGQTAILEFKIVDDEHSLEAALQGRVPSGSEILYQRIFDPLTNHTQRVPLLVRKRTLMTGDAIADARMDFSGEFNQPLVAIRFNTRGARLFDRIAAEHVNQRLAIILDGSVYSAPVIRQAHYGGRAVIEGNFTAEEAHDLAIVLRAGSLPAPVTIAEQRSVGPSLGADSIRMGVISVIVGGILVLVFMAVYYRAAGVIADISLVLNLFLVLATLVAFKATLSLPGIAGLVLTVGMAVDANVIIIERIREELRVGKTPRAAIDSGYKNALSTILDANITTMIAALVLFQFGTGPVKGFAVTLSIGIFWSVVLAIFFTRTIYDYLVLVRRVKQVAV